MVPSGGGCRRAAAWLSLALLLWSWPDPCRWEECSSWQLSEKKGDLGLGVSFLALHGFSHHAKCRAAAEAGG